MPPIRLSPEDIAAELAALESRLAAGAEALPDLTTLATGACQRDAVAREAGWTLWRYRPLVDRPHAPPLLVVYSLVNRPDILDLQAGRSLVEGLLREGVDVYLLDWARPGPGDRGLSLEDYVEDHLGRCIRRLVEHAGCPGPIDVLGVCQGGTLALCHAALHPARVRRLVSVVTPVDFHTPDNLLTNLLSHVDVDLLVDTLGNVPGSLLNFAFLSLSPFRLTGQKYLNLLEIADDAENLAHFLLMERWLMDSPDQAGEAFRAFAKDVVQGNKLIRGELRIGTRRVDLARIRAPVLNVYATRDHLVPPAAARALAGALGETPYSELAFEGGHIGIFASRRAQAEIPPAIARWLRAG